MKRATVLLAAFAVASATAPLSIGSGGEKSAFDNLKPPEPKAWFRPRALEKPEAVACGSCHARIVEEWKDTAHALAWVDEDYREQLEDKKRPESCYGCHIPKALMQAELTSKPPARDDDRQLGIRCESCHLSADGAMLGPRGTPTSAHASRKSDAFAGAGSDALCISCHKVSVGPVLGIAKDFEEARSADSGLSCVGCHCAEVEQAFANAPSGSAQGGSAEAGAKKDGSAGSGAKDGEIAPTPIRKGRSHALQTPRDPTFLARAFELSARGAGNQTVVSVKNAAGHRVPGLIGRKIALKAEALDAQGKVLAQGTVEIDAESTLGVGETLSIHLDAAAAKVRVTGVHGDPRAEGDITFLDASLSVAAR